MGRVVAGGTRVVVLPDPEWDVRDSVLSRLSAATPVLDVTSPPDARLVCANLIGADLAPPLVVIAHGASCQLLPPVALSLRTQHLDTCCYVLIDPDAPPSSEVWPEAPVTVVSTDQDAAPMSLRGWPVERASTTNLGVVVSNVVVGFLDVNPQRD